MRVLLASSEVHPYSKTGGLGDMVGAMARALAEHGHQVGVVTPLYGGSPETRSGLELLDWRMELPLGNRIIKAEVWTLKPHENLTVYFIRQREFFDRPGIYQSRGGQFPDNGERFIFFSKAVTHLGRYLPWKPQVLHLHDWHTGLVPVFVHHQKLTDGWWQAPPTILTIHNLAYQGNFPASLFPITNLPQSYFSPEGVEFYGELNCLKAGILHANLLTTVSPTYAREITTTREFGHGLEGLLRMRLDSGTLIGILNGVDYSAWNTTNNPHLVAPYDINNLEGKARNKRALQAELGLPVMDDTPLFGNVSRLTGQKGIDLLLRTFQELLPRQNLQLAMLGNGEETLEIHARQLAARFPRQVAVRIGFNEPLAHRIEAGCDFYVMPSYFEPCGLNQMYSLRYGTIPIVRDIGGLADSVVDPRECALDNSKLPTGIKFKPYSVHAMAHAVYKALRLYKDKPALLQFRTNGMKADFSWDKTAARYLGIYQDLLAGNFRA